MQDVGMSYNIVDMKLLFSYKGTINRKDFLCFALPCDVLLSVFFKRLFLYSKYILENNDLPSILIFAVLVITLIIGITGMYVTPCIIIKRLRDEGLSSWFVVPALLLGWHVCAYSWLPLCLLKGREESRI